MTAETTNNSAVAAPEAPQVPAETLVLSVEHKGEQWFCSEVEAQAAGRRKALR